MSSYTKPIKVCQDYAVATAQVNVVKENLNAFKTLWTAEHGSIQPASLNSPPLIRGDPYNAFGTHNTPPIPRAMLRVKPTSSAGVAIAVTPDSFGAAVSRVSKVSTGLWHVSMDNRLALFFGDPRPAQANNTVTRFCQPYGALVAGVANGLVIGCYDLNAGDFVLTDYEFSVALYSYS